MKDVLNEKRMEKLASFRQKKQGQLTDNNNKNKKEKGTKRCVMKRKLKFEDYKHCLEATQRKKQ